MSTLHKVARSLSEGICFRAIAWLAVLLVTSSCSSGGTAPGGGSESDGSLGHAALGLSTTSVTQSGDELRSGWYSDQPQLSPTVVGGSTFGPLFNATITGQVYAQPLVAAGTLLIATESNNVYGLDPETGASRWSRNLGTPLDANAIPCGDLQPVIGITGTPVIDRATNVAYLFSKVVSGSSVAWYAHAMDVVSGAEQPGFPVLITGTAANDPSQIFNAKTEMQRPGLLLLDGVVYAGFGAHCDVSPWIGWIVGVSTSGAVTTLWTSEAGPNKVDGAGIWQSGGGLVSDGSGQILFATGNGGTPVGPLGGKTPPSTLGESIVRVAVQANGTLRATDFFTPYDGASLDSWDADLSSGGPIGLMSPYFGTTAFPHLLVTAGKQGYVYLLDRDNLGGVGNGPSGGDAVVGRIGPFGGVWSKPAV